jgi:flagellar protein FliJ
MKFKFSLAPVLRVRQHEEKLQKQKLAREVKKQQEILRLREEVQQKLNDYLENAGTQEASSVHTIQRHGNHMMQYHHAMSRLGEDLKKAEGAVNREREKLADAHKSCHILEKAKETEKSLFSEKLERIERKFMDEIATQSFSR